MDLEQVVRGMRGTHGSWGLPVSSARSQDTNSPACVAQQWNDNSFKDFISQSSLVVGVASEGAFPKRSYVSKFVHVVSVVPSESRGRYWAAAPAPVTGGYESPDMVAGSCKSSTHSSSLRHLSSPKN